MSEKPDQTEHLYTSFGKPFPWGNRMVVLATEQVQARSLLPAGTFLSKKVLLDAQTYKEITMLDSGSHVIYQQPGEAVTISPVVESASYKNTLQQLSTVEYKRLMYGNWVEDEKRGDLDK